MSTTVLSTPRSVSRPLHFGLWTVQLLLAALFAMAGLTKLTQPIDALSANMPWALDVPAWVVRFNALAELLGALGLLLPSLTRIKPQLTTLAALGLATVMALAVGLHITRGELAMSAAPAIIGLLAGFVAWGRRSRAPIAPR